MPHVRVGGALALLTRDVARKDELLTLAEEERSALEKAANEAQGRAASAVAKVQQLTAALRIAEQERDDARISVTRLEHEVLIQSSKSSSLSQQHDIVVGRLQQVLRDAASAEDDRRNSAVEISRLERVLDEAQGEIKRLFDECARQRDRADRATASLSASLSNEKMRSAALASANVKKEVRAGSSRESTLSVKFALLRLGTTVSARVCASCRRYWQAYFGTRAACMSSCCEPRSAISSNNQSSPQAVQAAQVPQLFRPTPAASTANARGGVHCRGSALLRHHITRLLPTLALPALCCALACKR
jgi:hypothetical protein